VRFSITHQFNYSYDSPVRLSTQYLRLTPRDTTRQKVLNWNLATPGTALRTTDGYGNVLHVLTIDKPVSGIAIQAQGSVETAAVLDEPSDFTGAPLSPLLFLRPTGLTRADQVLVAFAEKYRRNIDSHRGLRELAAAIHNRNGDGSAADAAHAFIACCRHVGVPARYVSGYVYSTKSDNHGVAMHAWAEAWVVDRWRSFDTAHDNPIGEAHIKIAIGADYLDACPVRGVRVGGGAETLTAQAQVMAQPQQ
jgi:transglutaminase-like putative cysteine protease